MTMILKLEWNGFVTLQNFKFLLYTSLYASARLWRSCSMRRFTKISHLLHDVMQYSEIYHEISKVECYDYDKKPELHPISPMHHWLLAWLASYRCNSLSHHDAKASSNTLQRIWWPIPMQCNDHKYFRKLSIFILCYHSLISDLTANIKYNFWVWY